MKRKLSLIMIFLVFRSMVYAQVDTYTNPVIRGFNPDPSICRVGEDYYAISSTSYIYPGIPIYHSRDLVHWKMIGHCLTRPEHYLLDKNNNRPEIYAGTLRYHNGIFYMITTDVSGGGNFYITASNPEGPWSDPVLVDRPVFDPSLFFDDDGRVYYTRRGEFADKDIVQAEIDIKTGKLLTPLKSISKGLVGDDTEGPHLFKRDGWYYLTMGEGGSRYLHMQSIARSKNPWGPFEKCPHNPVISQHNGWWHHTAALGHADFIDDHLGNSWAVCLGQRKAGYMDFSVIGRETFLMPVEWKDGWPYVEEAALTKLEVHTKTLPVYLWPEEPVREEFDSSRLALKWNLMAYPFEKLYSLSERPGYLRLLGTKEPLMQSQQVAFVGIRQTELAGEIVTSMEFEPTADNEEAGVAVYQSPECKYLVFSTLRNDKNVVCMRKIVGDMVEESDGIVVDSSSILLKVVFNPDRYVFWFSDDGNQWEKLGSGLTNLVSTDVARSFGGIFLGLYASGNGEKCKNPADFDWFDSNMREIRFND
ncbi:glycoside hydrolase family 43 protein [Sunxiuqinia sp. A32]|uniref:glycoside hydrolase family 43 protein n=1 Tax=Sunxiuqinia sp. A32 TaxID=3461496 RepID=UPI0040464A5F